MGQVDSIVYTNLLRFGDYNGSESSINSGVSEVHIGGYNFRLDTVLIHPLVFEKVNVVYVYNKIGYLQEDLFKHLSDVFEISLGLDSVGNFYHQFGIGWMLELKKGRTSTVVFIHEVASSLKTPVYVYPDKDFCIFASFPFQNLIFLRPNCEKIDTCTKLLIFLARSLSYGQDGMYCISECYCSIYENCLNYSDPDYSIIKSKLDVCNNLLNYYYNPVQGETYSDYYGARLLSVFIIDLFPFIFIPLACLIGLVLNLFVIRTVERNEER
jgi:hypothetical protein